MRGIAILAGRYRDFGKFAATIRFVVVLASANVAHDGLIFLHTIPPYSPPTYCGGVVVLV